MAVDMFLKIGDVKGESKDKSHKDEIDVLAWSWGLDQTGTMHLGGGGGAGKVNVHDISITKYVDKSSPNLMKMCCMGKQFPEAVLTVRKAGEKPLEYIILKMKKVIITSLTTGGGAGEEQLTENVSFNFAEVAFDYQPQKEDGSPDGGAVTMAWDIAANTEAG